MHFVGSERMNPYLFLGFLLAAGSLSVTAFVFGLSGKGSPRIVAIVWSVLLLAQSVGTWWIMLTSA
jgi:hypothetical protein